MVEIERGVHLLPEPRGGIVADAHVVFFENDVELGSHHVVGEHQSGHAVGLELHHLLELVARDALEIAGVIGGGEGVLLPADGGHDLREASQGIFGRALEHEMFEEVSKPRLARRLIGRADFVPDHMRDDRRAMIGNHHDLETVRQREVGDLGTDAGLRGSGEQCGGQRGNGQDQSIGHELAFVGLSPPRCTFRRGNASANLDCVGPNVDGASCRGKFPPLQYFQSVIPAEPR